MKDPGDKDYDTDGPDPYDIDYGDDVDYGDDGDHGRDTGYD